MGWSSDLPTRIRNVARDLPDQPFLRWVFTLAGREHERELHQRLAEWRLWGEWFSDCEDTQIEILGFANEWPQRQTRKPAPHPHFLKLSEFATLAQISKRTAYRWVQSGRLKATKIGAWYKVAVRDLIADHPSIYERLQEEIQPQLGRAVRFSDEGHDIHVH